MWSARLMRNWEADVRVLVVPNTGNPASVEASRDVVRWLGDAGMQPVMVQDDAEAVGIARVGVQASEIGEPVLAVSLGGDGTILKTVHLLGEVEVPVLGVNFGRRGFMTGAQARGMTEAISSALAGEGRIERRATLQAVVTMAGRDVGTYRALNEVFVGRGGAGRVVDISLHVNDHHLATVGCDGMIVATSTGSTAYALSAGGPVIAPDLSCMAVVPVAPHTLALRPLVVGASDVVELRIPAAGRGMACVSVDGIPTPCRGDMELVTVSRADTDVLLVKLDGRDFYEVLRDEFLGG